MKEKKAHAFRIYGAGPNPIRTIYYRRLMKHGGSLVVSLPAAIKSRWGAIRDNVVKVTLWDTGLVTVEPMEGLNYEASQDRAPRAHQDHPPADTDPD